MKCLKIVDGQVHYIVVLDFEKDLEGNLNRNVLNVHSVWRFFPGRNTGEKVSSTVLPWHARQQLADETGNALP